MTGLTALDVVIGLVFIYALYSLLTTTIMEFVALIFQLRARNLKRALHRLFADDEFFNEFVDTPIIKAMYSDRFSWLFKVNTFPSYIGSETFTKAINYLLIFKDGDVKLDKDNKQSVLDNIRKELYKEKHNNKESYKYLRFLFEVSGKDMDKFIKSVEDWYDASMERCGGWFKKNMTFLTFGIAFLISMLFNIDSIEMVDQLSRDPKAREQYVELAGQMLSNPEFMSSSPEYDTNLETRLLKDTALFTTYGKDSIAFRNAVTDSVNQHVFDIQKVLISRMDTLYATSQKAQSVLRFERGGRAPWFFNSWLNFLGCLITALALSLGAPFWFDLLNKFMKLRTSFGVKDKKEPATVHNEGQK